MIPGKIERFVTDRANVGVAGTRDRDHVPHVHRVVGWRVGTDHATLTFLVPSLFTDHLLESLEDNGQLAVTLEEFPSHETYQFKGRFLRHRSPGGDDRALNSRLRERFVAGVRSVFAEIPAEMLQAYFLEPAIAVDLAVEEIYLQTPGPGAGSRLVPPAATGRN